jgi:hypothetical protein
VHVIERPSTDRRKHDKSTPFVMLGMQQTSVLLAVFLGYGSPKREAFSIGLVWLLGATNRQEATAVMIDS